MKPLAPDPHVSNLHIHQWPFRKRVLRLLAIGGTTISCIYAFNLAVFFQSPIGALFDIALAILHALTFLWIRRHKLDLASYWILGTISVQISLGGALFVGPEGGFQYYFLMIGPVAFLLFLQRGFIHQVFISITGAGLFMAAEMIRVPSLLAVISADVMTIIYYGNILVIIFGILFIVKFFTDELLDAHFEQRRLIFTDHLTGLMNRRYVIPQAERLYSLCERNSRSFSLILADIDHFKRINDTYGHLTGDHILRVTAQSLKECLRNSDVIGRFGGEEFIIILPETSEVAAKVVAEKIRNQIALRRVEVQALPEIQITISAGIAAVHPTPEKPSSKHQVIRDLISRADDALYTAKRLGRNRAIVFDAK